MVKKPKLNKIPGKKQKVDRPSSPHDNSKFDVCVSVCLCVIVFVHRVLPQRPSFSAIAWSVYVSKAWGKVHTQSKTTTSSSNFFGDWFWDWWTNEKRTPSPGPGPLYYLTLSWSRLMTTFLYLVHYTIRRSEPKCNWTWYSRKSSKSGLFSTWLNYRFCPFLNLVKLSVLSLF